MNAHKDISLLPVNSFEVESHLTDFGCSLVAFAKKFRFSEKATGILDCDFIQSIVIEFMAEFKLHFIAYLGIYEALRDNAKAVNVYAAEHTNDVMLAVLANARETDVRIVNADAGDVPALKRIAESILIPVKNRLFQIRSVLAASRAAHGKFPEVHPGQLKILMSTYNPNTIHTLTPIQDQLNLRSDICVAYLTNRLETYERLTALGYPNIFFGPKIRSEKTPALNDSILKEFVHAYFSEAFPYGKGTQYFKRQFYKSLRRKLLFALKLYSPVKSMLKAFKPDSILVSSGSTVDAQILIQTAEVMGIQAVEMTHGMFHDTPILKFQNVPVKLVWNRHQYDLMKKYRPEIACSVVGNPKHDSLLEKFSKSPPPREVAGRYILFVSTPGNNISISSATYLSILKDVAEAACSHENIKFVYKLHPSESTTKIKAAAEAFGAPDNLLIEKAMDVYSLMFYAEIVIVVTSTVGYEALLFDKKIICYSIRNSDKWMPLSSYGLAEKAANARELKSAISSMLNVESGRASTADKSYFVMADGRSMDRVMNIILKK